MKIALLSLSFLLSFGAPSGFVHDTDGKPVRNHGGPYYILPVLRGNGGGLQVAKLGEETCPSAVVQSSSKGLPVRISTLSRIAFITSHTLLKLEFKEAPTCAPKPLTWHIAEESQLRGSVKIGSNRRFLYRFKIAEADSHNGCKLMYCSSASTCRDLGIVTDERKNRRLVVRDGNPLIVEFQNAYSKSASAKYWSMI